MKRKTRSWIEAWPILCSLYGLYIGVINLGQYRRLRTHWQRAKDTSRTDEERRRSILIVRECMRILAERPNVTVPDVESRAGVTSTLLGKLEKSLRNRQQRRLAAT